MQAASFIFPAPVYFSLTISGPVDSCNPAETSIRNPLKAVVDRWRKVAEEHAMNIPAKEMDAGAGFYFFLLHIRFRRSLFDSLGEEDMVSDYGERLGPKLE